MLRMKLLTLGILKKIFRLLQWSLHPLRFPRYRGTETLNRNFMLRMNVGCIFLYVQAQNTLGAAKTSAYYAVAPFVGAFLSIDSAHH